MQEESDVMKQLSFVLVVAACLAVAAIPSYASQSQNTLVITSAAAFMSCAPRP